MPRPTKDSHPLPMGTWIMTIDRRLYRVMLSAKTSEGDGYVCFPTPSQANAPHTFVYQLGIVEYYVPENRDG